MNTTTRLLIIEDDEELAEWMADYLSTKDYAVSVSGTGDLGLSAVLNEQPDLVILDGMLPGMDGLDVCKAARQGGFDKPIVMLTARDEEIDEVLGLEMGADDYLMKPVRARALLTRIRLHLQKYESRATARAKLGNDSEICLGNLVVNKKSRSVTLGDDVIKLTSNEFDVLWLLAINAGHITERELLVNELRGFEYNGFDRSIDLRVSRLRKKLNDDPKEPQKIKTIWGKGYLLAKAW